MEDWRYNITRLCVFYETKTTIILFFFKCFYAERDDIFIQSRIFFSEKKHNNIVLLQLFKDSVKQFLKLTFMQKEMICKHIVMQHKNFTTQCPPPPPGCGVEVAGWIVDREIRVRFLAYPDGNDIT